MKPSKHPHAKLTAEQVLYIRKNYIERHPEFGARALARKFDIDYHNILKVVKFVTYKTVR